MPIVVRERMESRESSAGQFGGGAVQVREYDIFGTSDEDQARNGENGLTSSSGAPLSVVVAGVALGIEDITLKPIYIDDSTQESRNSQRNQWRATVKYSQFGVDINTSAFTFDTSGGTARKFYVPNKFNQVAYPVDGNPAPDVGKSIGNNGDSIEGVDVVVPVFNFSLSLTIPPSKMTKTYMNRVFSLTGCVNADQLEWFIPFSPGEVLFLGANGTKNGDSDIAMVYRFAASPNSQQEYKGQTINKAGWDYIWFRSESVEDKVAKVMNMSLKCVFVAQVYPRADFSGLNP